MSVITYNCRIIMPWYWHRFHCKEIEKEVGNKKAFPKLLIYVRFMAILQIS